MECIRVVLRLSFVFKAKQDTKSNMRVVLPRNRRKKLSNIINLEITRKRRKENGST